MSAESAATWRELLDYTTAEERRTLLDTEAAVARYLEALRDAGLPAELGRSIFTLSTRARTTLKTRVLDVLALVLAELHGSPWRLLEGRNLTPS